MSKIFEALNKAHGDMAAVGLPLIETAGAAPDPDYRNGHVAEGMPSVEPVQPPSSTGVRTVAIQSASMVLPLNGSNGAASEQYRIIRTKIVHHARQPKLMVVSSAGSGDGKTISSINIAGVLALRTAASVLLIEGDFRHPNIADVLSIPAEPGLANVLAGECGLPEAIVRIQQYPNLYVLPSGKAGANPAELLDSAAWRGVCDTVRKDFDFTIIDAPPVSAVADYELIQATCEAVIMVIRPDHTDRTLCLKAIESVPKEKLLGAVINCASDWFLWRTHESYYYGSKGR